ncbi:MauE/DoxX family redox-associated membrane protein [Pedobacter helvus]|uniref:MauE/DoxX family redox-associated membrane protein n=1 Tax=Pedobacter helvus TaxID=2563444 RepID=A0ABW9JPI4_9SPHI|nr:MauE/DoxX family redox-associated membrane protein [Pedobacter ureilyticus]
MENQITLQKRFINKKLVVDLICYAFFILFLYASTSKLIDYEKSELQMSKSPIITDFAFILVWLVPLTEIAIAIMLMISRTRRFALYASLGLMSLFTAYIIAILYFTDNIPCSCGGVLEKMSWDQHLIFNIVFMCLGITAILLQTKIYEKKMD